MYAPIHVTYYTTKTWEESLKSGEKKMFSQHEKVSVQDGSVIVGVNKETKSIVCVAVADETFTQRSLLDQDVFSGDDIKYQKSELKLKSRRDVHFPLSMVGAACGIPTDDKTQTNVNKCTPISYGRVFYKGEGADEVLRKYRTLILSLC